MMARVVVADGFGRGKLAIAGAVIDAEIPKHVRAGQELRLTVRDVSAHQVVLGMSDQPAGVPVPGAELPGGGVLRVTEEDASEESGSGSRGSPGSQTLSLRYDAPTLGAVDLRFDLEPRLAAGERLGRRRDTAVARADARGRVARRADRRRRPPATVTVSPRHEPLDVYA